MHTDHEEYGVFFEDDQGERRGWLTGLLSWTYYRVKIFTRRRLPRARRRQGVLLRLIRNICIAVVAFLIVHAFLFPSYTNLPRHYRDLEERCRSGLAGCANPNNEKIFITISLHDPKGDLAGGEWGTLLLRLIKSLGPEHVFLSIYENDSGDSGRAGLDVLQGQLECKYSIVNDDHVPLDGFPTVTLPDGSKRVKRTVYLSEMRNRALRPLETWSEEDLGTSHFDRVLFLNDIIFHPIDAAHLLFNTNRGRDELPHYLAACALDYYWDPIMFYDTYAQRDAEGYQMGEQIYPIFSAAGTGISRHAMLAQRDAVPVKSCWGGMVAVTAKYITNNSSVLASPDSDSIRSFAIEPQKPTPMTSPIRFRGETEPLHDACECCLFMSDLAQAASQDAAEEVGIYVNPYIRVAYSSKVLNLIPYAKRWERLLSVPQRILTFLKDKPLNNPYRDVQPGEIFEEEVWIRDRSHEETGISRKIGRGREGGSWQMTERKGRSGLFCGIRNMQVMEPRKKDDHSDGPRWKTIEVPHGQRLDFPPGYN